jgi:predicted lysophospholipase L1 biosynthesis ABC-type transport system permease subunit
VVATDGTSAAVERARTVLERHIPATFAPETIAEMRARNADDVDRLQRLADIVLLASLPIAGCSLAVNVVGGLAERRRPFSLLRLTGVPLSTLRRVIALETTVPLVVSVVVAAGAGFAAAGLFVRAQLDEALEPPGALYYVLLVAGVAASLAIVASTLPLLASTTGPESARQD